tara:strand:+ start:15976 stop:17406 length:1431 start_codon:yes stop_codon:yes gene_type:complete
MTEDLALLETVSLESDITEIPIDKPLQDFYHHLSYNERIIFSAKFGDGKTYFLNKFFEEHKDEFVAIRIFPVNYQVTDNKDVFELIKKDILIHLLANDLVENEDFFDESIYAQNYLFNNGADIVLDILSDVPAVKVPAKIIQKTLKHLKKYKDDKGDYKASKSELIEKYLSKFENDTGVAEYDSISELITRIIKAIQKKGKKVILVIDDLDRIDPAHLFRILNVLTAHIDRDVVLQNEIEDGIGNNKFNFDHIITVFDFQNAQKIFHHLYGSGTDFDGYISKFISGKPFEYSLQKISYNFVIEYLSDNCGLNKKVLDAIGIGEAFDFSIRMKLKLIHNFDNEIIDCEDVKISSVNSFTHLLVLLKRLNVGFESVRVNLSRIESRSLLDLMGVGLYLAKSISFDSHTVSNHSIPNNTINIPIRRETNNCNWYEVNVETQDNFIKSVNFVEFSGSLNSGVLNDELGIIQAKLATYIKV